MTSGVRAVLSALNGSVNGMLQSEIEEKCRGASFHSLHLALEKLRAACVIQTIGAPVNVNSSRTGGPRKEYRYQISAGKRDEVAKLFS